MVGRCVLDTKTRIFQFKILNNKAYLTTSHGVWKFISHRGEYIPLSERQINLAMGYGNLFNSYQPIRARPISLV